MQRGGEASSSSSSSKGHAVAGKSLHFREETEKQRQAGGQGRVGGKEAHVREGKAFSHLQQALGGRSGEKRAETGDEEGKEPVPNKGPGSATSKRNDSAEERVKRITITTKGSTGDDEGNSLI